MPNVPIKEVEEALKLLSRKERDSAAVYALTKAILELRLVPVDRFNHYFVEYANVLNGNDITAPPEPSRIVRPN